MKLIVGLGNPGKNYEHTRHNAGFLAADFLANFLGFEPFRKSSKHDAEMTEGSIGGEKALLLKPQTFMNLSGRSVQSAMQFYKISTEDLVVIYDEAELPFGTLRVRPQGSAGGHNGMKSIIQELGTDDFTRVRLGIGALEEFKGSLESYVLGKLSDDEMELMQAQFEKLPKLLETLLSEGVEATMQVYN